MSLELIFEFIKSIKYKKISRVYFYVLKDFDEFLKSRGKEFPNFEVSDVEEFMNSVTPGTGRVFLSAIRQYEKWYITKIDNMEEFFLEEKKLFAIERLRPPKLTKKIKKSALTISELYELMQIVKSNWILYIATIVHFYFGARPIELSEFILDAKINWNERYMIIKTAKTGNERIIPWSPKIDPYLKIWYNFCKYELSFYKYPQEWYSHNVKRVTKGIFPIRITARVARKTFETQMMKLNTPQYLIDFILGHTTRQIGYWYADPIEILPELRDVMEKKHYMVVYKLI